MPLNHSNIIYRVKFLKNLTTGFWENLFSRSKYQNQSFPISVGCGGEVWDSPTGFLQNSLSSLQPPTDPLNRPGSWSQWQCICICIDIFAYLYFHLYLHVGIFLFVSKNHCLHSPSQSPMFPITIPGTIFSLEIILPFIWNCCGIERRRQRVKLNGNETSDPTTIISVLLPSCISPRIYFVLLSFTIFL